MVLWCRQDIVPVPFNSFGLFIIELWNYWTFRFCLTDDGFCSRRQCLPDSHRRRHCLCFFMPTRNNWIMFLNCFSDCWFFCKDVIFFLRFECNFHVLMKRLLMFFQEKSRWKYIDLKVRFVFLFFQRMAQ